MRYITILCILLIAGCTKNKEEDIIATCDAGYEGTQCTIEWRGKFIGTYLAQSSCDTSQYTIKIASKVGEALLVKVINLNNTGDTTIGLVYSSNQINPDVTAVIANCAINNDTIRFDISPCPITAIKQ